MKDYIQGNKEAWEEAFGMRDAHWGENIVEKVNAADYGFFNKDMEKALRGVDCKGKSVAQFCCNNGRELLSLVKSGNAKNGVGFDIAENQIAFAREKAAALNLPCEFVAKNILDIGNEYFGRFDVVIITIGVLNWFLDLDAFFAVVSRCMKTGGRLVINEMHPFTFMLANEGDDAYDPANRLSAKFSYFEHEWTDNGGMYYVTGRTYKSKTFTDFTHPLSEIISAMRSNGIAITGFSEYDYDISGMYEDIEGQGFPLSMILTGRKG